MKKISVTTMNYLEVLGSIAHMANSDYKDFFEEYCSIEDEGNRKLFVYESVLDGDIPDIEVVPEIVLEFLGLPSHMVPGDGDCYICTYNLEYLQ